MVRLNPNFEYGKICRIDDLFAKAVCRSKVVNLGEKWLTWAIISCILKWQKWPIKTWYSFEGHSFTKWPHGNHAACSFHSAELDTFQNAIGYWISKVLKVEDGEKVPAVIFARKMFSTPSGSF